jgi:hypothetical protein
MRHKHAWRTYVIRVWVPRHAHAFAQSRFLLGNRTVLGPSVYKKCCESVDRDWEGPVMFTGPDGASVFKVLDVGKYDKKLRWARNPEQNLDVEGEDYF